MDRKLCYLVLVCATMALSEGFVVSSPLDEVEKCIYTCDYCFKNDIVLKCANECLGSDGQMKSFWYKICPEFKMPLYFPIGMSPPDGKPKHAYENVSH